MSQSQVKNDQRGATIAGRLCPNFADCDGKQSRSGVRTAAKSPAAKIDDWSSLSLQDVRALRDHGAAVHDHHCGRTDLL